MNTTVLLITCLFELGVIIWLVVKYQKRISSHNVCKEAYISIYHTYRKIVGDNPQLISNKEYIAEDFKKTLQVIVSNQKAPGHEAFAPFAPEEYFIDSAKRDY